MNWQILAIGALLISAVGFGGGWYVNGLRKDAYWQQHEATALIEQEKMFKRSNAQSEARGNDLQTKLTGIAAERNRLRQQAAKCVPVATTSGQYNGPSADRRTEPHGLSDQWLYDFAAERDQVAAMAQSCQAFVNDIYKDNGQ